MAILNNGEIQVLTDAILEGIPDFNGSRPVLLQSIDFRLVTIILHGSNSRTQLTNDLGQMNHTERLISGEIPLETYLSNALPMMFGRQKQETIVRQILETVKQRTSGSPVLDIEDIPEIKERIIHSDDMVGHLFMELGLRAGESVMRLRVKSLYHGQPRKMDSGADMYFSGTGWLLSNELMITNHHVINARKDREPDALEDDLKLQATQTEVIYGHDVEEMEPAETVNGIELVAYDKNLDYAVLRIPRTTRSPLTLVTDKFEPGTTPVALNIIQHPKGKSKKYAIRNNLVTGSTERDLHYFTDTDGGASGAAVFNDFWQVVALHKSSLYVTHVQFQGKNTAYVNSGTRISLIVDDLRKRYPQLATEMGY